MNSLVLLLLFLVSSPSFIVSTDLTDQQKIAEIGKRLQQHVEQDAKRCYPKGHWGNKYAELHKEQLASPTGKRLVAVPHISGKSSILLPYEANFTILIKSYRTLLLC